jgi:DNA-binding GntR family transcriptional regulator
MQTRSKMNLSPDLLAGIQPVETATVGLLVYRGLRDFLMAGQLQPGQKLTLRELSEALGVSPMPVREAVRRLAAEGALEILPNRRIRVVMMTRQRFQELRRIRLALEGMAVEAATGLMGAEDVDRLVALNKVFTAEMSQAQKDGVRLFRVNKDIHFAIYEAAAMPMLLTMIEGLWLQAGPLLHYSLHMRANSSAPNPAPEWHERLFAALRSGDAAAARAALEGDVMSAGDQILEAGILPD